MADLRRTEGDDGVDVAPSPPTPSASPGPGPGSPASEPARRRYPSWPLIVMALVALVDQVDVSVARGVLPYLEDEWSLDDTQLGWIVSVFVFVSTLAAIPAGYLADHFRRTRVIGWTLLSWSGLIMLSATAVNYLNLLVARAAMGVGQAVDDPASTSYLGDSYPARMRARVFAFQQVSFFVGGGIGLALGGWIGGTLGWRWAFAIVGLPGALIAIAVFSLREPRRGEAELPETMTWEEIEALPPREVDTLHGGEALTPLQYGRLAGTELVSQLRMIFGIRTMRFVLVGVAALLFTVSGIGTWLAIYHERYSGMSETQATASTGLLLGVCGLVGTLGGGAFSDRWHHRWMGGRIVIVVWSAVICAVLFMGSFALDSVPARLGLQGLGILLAAGAAPGLRAVMLDVVPPESRGVGASAMALTTSIFGQALAPVLVGFISDATGSLVTAFYVVFPPVIAGLLLLLRARHTLADDSQALITAVLEENAALEAQRREMGLLDGGDDAEEVADGAAGGDRHPGP